MMSEQDRAALTARLFAQNQFAMKLGLDAMRAAFAREQRPERHAPAALIAGTNGKGTTAVCLHAILVAHGERSGLYTSPHLVRLGERFRVDGRPVADEALWPCVARVMAEYGDGEHRLTFFELTTLIAALLFREQETTLDVYEIGLGGRLDAVNAIEPALSVITTIGYDHQQYLGETLGEIAGEKAGILRAGVPVVVGSQEYEEAAQALAELVGEGGLVYGRDFEACEEGIREGEVVSEWEESVRLSTLQRRHAATAWVAARVMLGARFDAQAAMGGLARVRWPGRLQEVLVAGGGGRLLLDAAHNLDGVRALFEHIESRGVRVGAVVCGGMADKALEQMFAPLGELGAPVFGALIQNARAASAERLSSALPAGLLVRCARAEAALVEALGRCGEGEVVLVYGSIYLLGECFEALGMGEVVGEVLVNTI
jgi:dihydrofolate synthase / folylpolyglutamate synthase